MKRLPEDMCCLENVGNMHTICRYVVELIVTKGEKRKAMLSMVYPGICAVTGAPLI
jgi:hypothetical protein